MPDHVIIVGAGLAGSAAAVQLAAAGIEATVLERHAEPQHKVCGEFVSAEAALYLRDLGVHLAGLGAAEIGALRIFASRHASETRLPFRAFGISRRLLDEALLIAAGRAGARVLRGAAVRRIHGSPGQWVAEVERASSVCGSELFLASGKHDLRGWNRTRGRASDLVAFKQHWRLAPMQTALLRGAVELSFLRGGYGGLLLVEEDVANLCLVVDRRRLTHGPDQWSRLLAELRAECPVLDLRLTGGSPLWEPPLALASIPYGWMKAGSDGPWRLGDQAAVIPSFAGDGMAIALHSARLACRYYLAGMDAAAFQVRLHDDVRQPVTMATLLSRLLLDPVGQVAAGRVATFNPGLAAFVAARTRVPEKSVAHARGLIVPIH